MRTGILALTLLLSFTRVAFDIRVEAQSDGAAQFSGVYENTDVFLKSSAP